ncbi:hypothetical protein [Xanthomonas albilineans]|uniref:hypothetical protein n=1 Tax=Xanthomonas albilineans TaxID=29447 RepID=UPI0018B0CFA2|nr:hypothetical protein [Xanthomonas albilineans]
MHKTAILSRPSLIVVAFGTGLRCVKAPPHADGGAVRYGSRRKALRKIAPTCWKAFKPQSGYGVV